MGGFGEIRFGEYWFGGPPTPAPAADPGYYLRLVTSEYQFSANMLSWLKLNIQLCQDVLLCLNTFVAAYSIDQAVGPQLDTLGVIIGQPRTVGFQPSGGVSPVLDDNTYRILLKARIFQNHWDGKIDSLITIWSALFPSGLLIVNDHQNMTVDLYVAAPFTSIIQDLIIQGYILPRPQAVLYIISFAVLPMFGFDRSDSFVAPFDVGHFV